MKRPVQKADICGKTIGKLLQTPWEHSDSYSSCQFYIELTDGSHIHLEDDSIEFFEPDNCVPTTLQDIDTAPQFPALWLSDECTGVGVEIDQVLVDYYGRVYLQLANQYFVRSVVEEGQTALSIFNYEEFLRWARYWEFFDYWTGELTVFENLRAIDIVIASIARDLQLWEDRDLLLSIGIVRDGAVTNLRGLTNERRGDSWAARFVVAEVGTYQVRVQRAQGEFVADVQIDQSTIAAGRLQIHVG
jgi:hypothetical protein